MEEFTAGDVRARTFRVTMRGFDQGEVSSYLGQVAQYLEAVQQQLHQVGITEVATPHDLAAEYSAVGEEVARVLAEARSAADAMRSRATAETAEWRASAGAETESARRSAWETGTEMLEQVMAQCDALLVESQQTALRLRSEAERESARMVTDAQREREELTRAGREEAEKTINAARREADGALLAARQQADVAHERARALEERRAELMDELETTQKALLGIEDESTAGGGDEVSEEPAESEPKGDRSRRPDEEGGVRIVAAQRKVAAEPVDADALAAEVEAMRTRPVSPAPSESPPMTPSASLRSAPPPRGEETDDPGPVSPAPSSASLRSAPPPRGEETGDPGPEPEEPEPEPGAEDPLAGLFDELRTVPNGAKTGEISDNGAAPDEPAAAVLTEPPEETPRESEPAALDSSIDPFALRDRLLLPVQNRALRLVKRQLVSAQNLALEELRLDAEWSPDPGLMNGEIGGVLVELVEESAAAGVAAAAELLGSAEPVQPDVEVEDPSAEFTRTFVDAVTLSLERSRSAHAGKRETSSALSRVFRAWRTDDAERRVRLESRNAYHRGLLAALKAMGCDQVSVALFDRSCVDHSDSSAPWPIVEGPPAGVLIPPASLECSCTVVPDC